MVDGYKNADVLDRMVNLLRSRPHTPAAPATEDTIEQIAEIDNRIRKERKAEREQVLKHIENYLCSCVWSNAPDCPGATNGECICDGCERFEYPFPEDAREWVKSLRGGD